MNVLVTGANGFVGVNVVRALAEHGQPVIALTRGEPDPLILGYLGGHLPNVHFARGDVRDRESLIKLVERERIRGVVHAAAITPTPAQERANPSSVIDVNFGGTVNVLEAARLGDVERLVFVGSDGVYGAPRPGAGPVSETHPLVAANLYAIAKITAEQVCRRHAALFGFRIAIGRLGAAYGPMERATASRRGLSLPHRLIDLARTGQEPRVYRPSGQRDYCHVADAAEAFSRLLLTDTLTADTYNVGSGQATALFELLTLLATRFPGFGWREADDPAAADLAILPQQERGALNLDHLRRDTGFVPRFSIAQGLDDTLAWLGANQPPPHR